MKSSAILKCVALIAFVSVVSIKSINAAPIPSDKAVNGGDQTNGVFQPAESANRGGMTVITEHCEPENPSIPEPASALLLGASLLALGTAVRRGRKAATA